MNSGLTSRPPPPGGGRRHGHVPRGDRRGRATSRHLVRSASATAAPGSPKPLPVMPRPLTPHRPPPSPVRRTMSLVLAPQRRPRRPPRVVAGGRGGGPTIPLTRPSMFFLETPIVRSKSLGGAEGFFPPCIPLWWVGFDPPTSWSFLGGGSWSGNLTNTNGSQFICLATYCPR